MRIHRGISNPLEPINCIDFYRVFLVYLLYEELIKPLLHCIVFPISVSGNSGKILEIWKHILLVLVLHSYIRRKKSLDGRSKKNHVSCVNNLLFYIIHIRIIKDINDSWHTLHHAFCATKWLFAIVAAMVVSFLLHVLDTTILGSSHDSTKSPR